jgi:hypothetical protein
MYNDVMRKRWNVLHEEFISGMWGNCLLTRGLPDAIL